MDALQNTLETQRYKQEKKLLDIEEKQDKKLTFIEEKHDRVLTEIKEKQNVMLEMIEKVLEKPHPNSKDVLRNMPTSIRDSEENKEQHQESSKKLREENVNIEAEPPSRQRVLIEVN